MRYNELQSAIPDISDRMLAERRREFELEGVVLRSWLPAPATPRRTATHRR